MVGGKTQKAQHLHFAPRKRRHILWRLAPVAVVLLVLLAIGGVIKAATAADPALSIHQVLPASVNIPGQAPKPAWPSAGEAAVEVQGLPPLGSSGPNQAIPIASLAKVMTAYVVLQDHPIQPGQDGFSVTIGAPDVADYQTRLAHSESVVAVSEGETITEAELLQGLLVASGNNFAVILADHESGSINPFISKMNATAAALGMTHTTYTDPSGLHTSTVSTASDQLVLAARAMANPAFAQIVAMTSVTLPVEGTASNFNTAVGNNGYVGIKTGSEAASGGCLMFANHQARGSQTVTILGVVLGQQPGSGSTGSLVSAAVSAANALVTSVVAGVESTTIVPAGTVVAKVVGADGKAVDADTTLPLSVLGYGGTAVPLTVSLEKVGTGVRSGQVVAHVSIGGGPGVDAAAQSALSGASFAWKLRHDY